MDAIAKKQAAEAIDSSSSALKELSSDIWSHPELEYQEKHAHALLTQFLEDRGFQVEREFSLSTAFRATWGTRQPGGGNVAVICEYDALPDIGHACGHNLIAEAGVAAGLGVQAAMKACPKLQGNSITVLGCPAEEGGGGKIDMIEKGCFSDIDCALMVHPFTENAVIINALARAYLGIVFKPSSADSMVPASPLDAATLAYTSLSMLRQQLRPTWRIHGIISDGGSHPKVRPLSSELLYYFRAPTHSELEVLLRKVRVCFESAAQATGCTVSITERTRTYKDLISNSILSNLFLENTQELGLDFLKATQNFSASTDMGNVSYVVPSIHPLYSIGTSAVNHTRAYTEATNTDTAHGCTRQAAKAMAMTAIDLLCSPDLLSQVQREFQQFSD